MRILIIGAGLSGLALAAALDAAGHDYIVLEARDRIGGRIQTEHSGSGYFDMGPAWFWSGQPRIAALVDRFGLAVFAQYTTGAQTFEDANGQVQHGHGPASMQGALRLKGGMAAMTQSLANQLPPERLRLNAQVTHLAKTTQGITATLDTGTDITADHVVLAMPPRIAAQITYTPALPTPAMDALQRVSTWMAGQAKALAVYDTPFWRNAGLSGDAFSRLGPMVEIHDASPADGGPYGLFGFIGIPPHARRNTPDLRPLVIAQLVRLFGAQAGNPKHLYLKDWAYDPHTATKSDMAPLYIHPDYGMPAALDGLWDDRLILAGTEFGAQFGGYLEGALVASEATLAKLLAT